jgi:2-oxoglutarate ferredoxin oxidoreductase subunit alpha
MSKAKPGNVRLMSGNEAVVVGALSAGCDFFSGYPITPSTEILEELTEQFPKCGGRYVQMEDEIGAMACTIGAALAGARALTATSGPGFSLKQENIGFACMAEVPCVIVNVMRGGPSTGLPTGSAQADVMQAKWGTHGDHGTIALAPSTATETYWMTRQAFELAEHYRNPVILLLDEILGHGSERVALPATAPGPVPGRKRPTVPPEAFKAYENTPDGVPAMADFGTGYRHHVTGLSHDETGFPSNKIDIVEVLHRRLVSKIDDNVDKLPPPEVVGPAGARVALVSYGSSARSAKRARVLLEAEGHEVKLVRLTTIWPFQSAQIMKALEGVEHVLVVEMNAGQISLEIERVVAGKAKVRQAGKLNGELLCPDEIAALLREVL